MSLYRLDTQELIQVNRNSYEASKYQQKIQELQLTLQLKSKQLLYFNAQLSSLKQQHAIKLKLLEGELTSHKKELAEIRFNSVRNKRLQTDRHEKEVELIRQQYHQKLSEKQEEQERKCASLKKMYENQILSIRQKYQNSLKFEKQQNQTSKHINQDHSTQSYEFISQLQEEKRMQAIARKEAEQKIQFYKESLEKLKTQFQRCLSEKDQKIGSMKGEIEGMRLKQRFLSQQLEEEKNAHRNDQHIFNTSVEQLKQLNSKLAADNAIYQEMINKINTENLNAIKQKSTNDWKQPLASIYECSHVGLIKQMEANLKIKQAEIMELKGIIEEWTRLIGFDKPLSKRISELQERSLNVEFLNKNWTNKLKLKNVKKATDFR